MSVKDLKNSINSKVEVIKRLNDNPEEYIDDQYQKFLKDLPSADKLFGQKLSDLKSKFKKNKDSHKDVFTDLVETVEKFLGTDKIQQTDALMTKQRLKQLTQESVNHSLRQSKKIIMESAQKVLFAGDGICGGNNVFTVNSVTIKPTEFDFMNVLTVDPNSSAGKIMYEDLKNKTGYVKMNRNLYSGFTTPNADISFNTLDNQELFKMNWNDAEQYYLVSGLTGSTVDNTHNDIGAFITSYYSSIEHLDISGITKTAMLLTMNGDGTEPPLFSTGLNDLNRLLNKICGYCGNPSNGLVQNATTQFNENDPDEDSWFDFNATDGIDFDKERARLENVLKFVDCGNLEVPTNPVHFSDFVYMSNKNINDAISTTMNNVAMQAHIDSNESIPFQNLQISILNDFILNLPKALIGSVLSPKYLLPIILIYKAVTTGGQNIVGGIKNVMGKLKKFFKEVIQRLLWDFIGEFWRLVKIDLLKFLQSTALRILKNKKKRYYLLIASLLALLGGILALGLDNCDSLYKLINQAIDLSLKGGSNITVPSPLLLLAAFRPGLSTDRAIMNAEQELNKSGVNTGPIFGVKNDITDLIRAIINGYQDEHDENGKVEVAIVTPAGPQKLYGFDL